MSKAYRTLALDCIARETMGSSGDCGILGRAALAKGGPQGMQAAFSIAENPDCYARALDSKMCSFSCEMFLFQNL